MMRSVLLDLEAASKHTMPDCNYHFERDDIEAALACLDEYGFCVIRQLIDRDMVVALKDSIDRNLDPEGDLPPSSNRYHMSFAEDSEPVWDLVDDQAYMQFMRTVHGTADLCLHRSAAILRTPGEGMGRWHQDHRGHIAKPQQANDVLNRYPIPSGCWFYLNGSHPDRSGIAVIEKSNHLEWDGPEGFVMGPNRGGLYPVGGTPETPYDGMSVPGCVPVHADPGDLICFAALTWHANMATRERRYSCGIGFRPKTWRIDAPWPLPASAAALADRLPDHLKHFTDGYTGFDGAWRAE